CLQNLPVIFCLDRAGVVGEDGATHHGMFDIASARCIPNCVIMAPSNSIELRHMMYTASLSTQPVIIRYPKGSGGVRDWKLPFQKFEIGKSRVLQKGRDCCVLALGSMVRNSLEANELLKNKELSIQLVDSRFVKPLDTALLDEIFDQFDLILTLEDGCKLGGFGSAILEYAEEKRYSGRIVIHGFPDTFVDHGSREELLQEFDLDAAGIAKKLMAISQP
ncbi:MAG: 1-deoxy-D-xylulose-5-phosphate synthase, partial [bacterium]